MTPKDSKKPDPLQCPHCGKELAYSAIAKLRDGTKLTFVVKQEPGHKLSAACLGGLLVNNERLFRALAQQHGTSLTVLVDGIRMEGDKTTVEFILAIPERKANKKAKERQRIREAGRG